MSLSWWMLFMANGALCSIVGYVAGIESERMKRKDKFRAIADEVAAQRQRIMLSRMAPPPLPRYIIEQWRSR